MKGQRRVKLVLGPRQVEALWTLALGGMGEVEGAEEGRYNAREYAAFAEIMDKLRVALQVVRHEES